MKYIFMFMIAVISVFAYAADEKKECKDPVLTPEIATLKSAINDGSLSLADGLDQLMVLSEDTVKSMQLDIDKMRAMLSIKRDQIFDQYAEIIEADPAKQEAIDAFMSIEWDNKNIDQDSLRAQESILADKLDKAFGGVHFRLNAFYHLGDASKNVRPTRDDSKKKIDVNGDLAPLISCNCYSSYDCGYGMSCGYNMYCSLSYNCGPGWRYACVDRCM